jgi:hypothetical protein
MKDRFDLEQEILECWKILNDLKENMEINNLIDYYEQKFQILWSTFEELVKKGFIK